MVEGWGGGEGGKVREESGGRVAKVLQTYIQIAISDNVRCLGRPSRRLQFGLGCQQTS